MPKSIGKHTRRPGLVSDDGLWPVLAYRALALASVERSATWWVGDWWAFGEREYGTRKATVDAPDWDGPAFQTCANAAWVSRAYPPETSLRREAVSWAVHRVLAGVDSINDRLAMLAQAEREGWTQAQAKSHLSRYKVSPKAGTMLHRCRPATASGPAGRAESAYTQGRATVAGLQPG
jgi:hypothetical protein